VFFDILDFDVDSAFVKDWRFSWKYLIDLADWLVTKMFWSLFNFAYTSDLLVSAH
jgi:hypothetical protein